MLLFEKRIPAFIATELTNIEIKTRPQQTLTMTSYPFRKCLVCFILCLFVSGSNAIQSPRRKVLTTGTTNKILELRGGDLGPICGTTVAKTFSGLAVLHAVAGTLSRKSMQWFGIYIPKGSLSDKYLHGVGASAASIAVASYLAVTGIAGPVEKAVAYGLLTRLLYMTSMIFTDDEKKVGMKFSMFTTMWLVLGATVYALLQGMKDSLALAKVVSLVIGVHGLFLHTYPGVVLRKTCISVGPGEFHDEIFGLSF
jgi:hypothetical protein